MYAIVWKLWLERNIRVCNNKSKAAEEIFESIVWTMSEWVCKRKEFGNSLEDLNRSWATLLKGAWHTKTVHKMIWTYPTIGVLKLNFDGSF